MKYVMVLLVPFYRVDDNVIACESAFAAHLKELLPRIAQWGSEIVIHSPQMSEQTYTKNKHHLSHIQCKEEHIYYLEAFPAEMSRLAFFLQAPFTLWPKMWRLVKSANVVHSSASKDLFKAFTITSLLFAAIQGKKSILVMDIDHRHSAKMLYETGRFSFKSYCLSRYLYTPFVSLQLRFAVKYCNLLMLKGRALVEDYGKGKQHVKNFYNTVHDLSFVLSESDLKAKLAAVDQGKKVIRLVYFGRVVEYKGIQDMIEATGLLADHLLEKDIQVSLSIIGAGDVKEDLQALVERKELGSRVNFIEPLSYGDELFDELKTYDFLLAAPKSEDTPRSVFDAMACGLPIIAYDTYYYKDLESTGAVQTVPWLSVEALAKKIVSLYDDKQAVKDMINHGRDFAINNTQEVWLNKRVEWTKEFLS
ncbi:MAG: glycosyltransferase involved in cell wall biosynthesis [Candidatus Endobugula sp.]|jgi:glycosyltransferase involved in cell wall biosynthesis